MTNMQSLLIPAVLAAVLLTSCNGWLDVESKSVVTEDDLIDNAELAEAQFLSNYMELRKSIHSIGDGQMTYRQHHLDAYTDDGINNTPWENGVAQNYSPGYVFGQIFSQSSGETSTPLWNYREINTINKYIETYRASDNEQVLNTLGEAYFIRAFLYFEMVKRYGGVPIRASSFDDNTSINDRATEEASWNFIRDNLDSAITFLPVTQRYVSEDKDRANKMTAYALKSRAMLYAGTIARYGTVSNNGLQGIRSDAASGYLKEAAEAAKAVIESGKYTLTDDFGALFDGSDEDNGEIIFRFKNNKESGTQVFIDYWCQSYRIKQAEYCAFICPTVDVVEQFETLEGTIEPLDYEASYSDVHDFFAGRDKRLEASVIVPGGEFLGQTFEIWRRTDLITNAGTTSYAYENTSDWTARATVPGYPQYTLSGTDGVFLNQSGAGTTNYGFFLKKTLYGVAQLEDYLAALNDQDAVIIRYGEVVLNFAEAAVELASLGDGSYLDHAQTAFDELRSRHGGLPAKTMTLDVVRHERRIDLMYEGFRYWDLKRWRIGTQIHQTTARALHPVLNIDERTEPASIYFTLETADAPDLATRQRWFEVRDYYCPIPVSQSPGIIQNEGWN